MKGTLKNTSRDKIRFGLFRKPIKVSLIYKDQYMFDGFVVVERNDGTNFITREQLEPQGLAIIHILVDILAEMMNDEKEVKLFIKTKNVFYCLQLKSNDIY